MTTVRCTADSSNKFTCEVHVDSDFNAPEPAVVRGPQPAPPPQSPAPAPAPAGPNPAVAGLVSTFVSKTNVQGPPAPPITGAALKECVSEELGVVLAALNRSKSKILTALTIGKATLDAAMCLTDAQEEAAARNADKYCRDLGGVVTSSDADKITCEVHEAASEPAPGARP